MYNLDNIVKIYYSSVPEKMIIEEGIPFDHFPAQEFSQLSKTYILQYSDTEYRQLYEYIAGSIREEGHPFARMENRSGLNVFAALEELAEQLLIMKDNEVLCVYGKLIRFREVTRHVEEDLLVCAYLAMRYRRIGEKHFDFGWNTTIGHSNMQLRHIMERGISENHFHLYGSAPSFHLLWIYFMNHIAYKTLSIFAGEIEARQRVSRNHYSVQYSEDHIAIRILKAALIRLKIVSYLLREDIEEELDKYDVDSLLSGKEDISEYYVEIQKGIDHIRNYALLSDMGELVDYALYKVKKIGNAEQYWFAGERWIMYQMLTGELSGKAQGERARKYFQWFYAYLVIKQNIRSELVIVNDTVGFENFAIYSKRKNAYVDYDKMVEGAVYGSVGNGNIRQLEMRVSPKNKAQDNARMLLDIDSVIERRKKESPEFDYYYVFHFAKQKDEPLGLKEAFDGLHCRHYKKRRELEEQANALYNFRENYREVASEVLGIDGCSQEIGCRPEVFAQVFRFLSNHVVDEVLGLEAVNVAQLRMTFHVGEDFLDIVDGLRAVDEAIHFLNLQCGDRIGHGTVLGIDVRKWYLFKKNTIVLTKQDYLDNIVWLYHKLVEYKLDKTGILRDKLLSEFEYYFTEIYLKLSDGKSRKNFHFNIYTYYEAWKLRGDEPELYINGYFDKEGLEDRAWLVNQKYPEKFGNRIHRDVGNLYFLYHYDWDVRNNGEKSVEVYIPPIYVEGVVAVQKAMQKEFASLGIGIETNPSSNLAISPIQDYSEHPLVVMYNKDMTWDADQIMDCPQINVSINTDDKGVFHTSLENEYALMACAMEKMKDEKGVPLYNRQMIYQWIDNIREMGNQQSFKGK